MAARNFGSPQQLGGRLFGLVGAGLAFYGLSNSIYNGKLDFCVAEPF
jgi:hypothetical protein